VGGQIYNAIQYNTMMIDRCSNKCSQKPVQKIGGWISQPKLLQSSNCISWNINSNI